MSDKGKASMESEECFTSSLTEESSVQGQEAASGVYSPSTNTANTQEQAQEGRVVSSPELNSTSPSRPEVPRNSSSGSMASYYRKPRPSTKCRRRGSRRAPDASLPLVRESPTDYFTARRENDPNTNYFDRRASDVQQNGRA